MLFQNTEKYISLIPVQFYCKCVLNSSKLELFTPIKKYVGKHFHGGKFAYSATQIRKEKFERLSNGSYCPIIHCADNRILFIETENSNCSEKLKYPLYLNDEKILQETRQKLLRLNQESPECLEKVKKEVKVSQKIREEKFNSLQWEAQKTYIKDLPKYYLSLSKSRLTSFVVLTAIAGYVIAPSPFDAINFMSCAAGTALVSCSANTINQVFEFPFDSQMDRTKNRVLVRGLLTPLHCASFGVICGISGLSFLFGVNNTTALLGLLNLSLYTCIYTPLKRVSILNTWVGSIVGAIPPLMGWAACTGSINLNALVMAGILFAWQFPHFNALSWNLRQDYSRAGYRMMSVSHPDFIYKMDNKTTSQEKNKAELCKRTALRYAIVLDVLSIMAPTFDVTTWLFLADSLPLNIIFTYLAWKFYTNGDSKSSRNLFKFSLIYLPAIMVLMILSRKS